MQAETIYQTLLWVGALGVGVMGVMGAAAHGSHGSHTHGGHAHHGGDAGHGFTDSHSGHAGHTPHVHHGGHGHANGYGDHVAQGAHTHGAHHHNGVAGNRAESGATAIAVILGVISPMTLFSVSLGAGATGLLLGSRFPVVQTAIIAAIAGIALLMLVVRPLMRWVQRWVSKPAQALAGTIAAEAIAQNRFDAQGRGIVNVTIDGQVVRLLAYLERGDHESGVTVAPGDRLVVTQIDEAKNTCRVTKI